MIRKSIDRILFESIDVLTNSWNKKIRAVTYFIEPKLRLRVSKIFPKCSETKGDFRITLGKPNFAERKFYKKGVDLFIPIYWKYPKK
jgi:hypothetical protein